MAGNARGKIKEELEGMHKNLDWLNVHIQKIKALLGDTHPEIHACMDSLMSEFTTIDEQLMHIYATW